VTPLPLNKLAASFVNRFRAVTQPKPVLPAELRSPALAGVPARQARSACATRPPPYLNRAESSLRSDRPAGGPAKACATSIWLHRLVSAGFLRGPSASPRWLEFGFHFDCVLKTKDELGSLCAGINRHECRE